MRAGNAASLSAAWFLTCSQEARTTGPFSPGILRTEQGCFCLVILKMHGGASAGLRDLTGGMNPCEMGSVGEALRP